MVELDDEQLNPDSKPFFFPPNELQRKWFWSYHTKMHCLEKRPRIQGNYDSGKARNFVVTFEKCDPSKRDTCKSEEEITEWIKGKFILIFENTWAFR